MSMRMRESKELMILRERNNALKQIDAAFDFGGGISAAAVDGQVSMHQAKLDSVNSLLVQVIAGLQELDDLELVTRDLSARILSGAAVRFGRDSAEYSSIGGTRMSDRKRPHRSTKKAQTQTQS